MLPLRSLFDARVELAEVVSLGQTPLGERRVINITGGTFKGDRLHGRVRPGGADWQLVRADGAADLDARYTLETATGALLQVRARGCVTARRRSWPGLQRAKPSIPPGTTSARCCASRPAPPSSTG
jgi:hypothetical protein